MDNNLRNLKYRFNNSYDIVYKACEYIDFYKEVEKDYIAIKALYDLEAYVKALENTNSYLRKKNKKIGQKLENQSVQSRNGTENHRSN